MLFTALATDYDGTLARDGRVDASTLDALMRLKAVGKRLILITGRDLAAIRGTFDAIERFDVVVAENGAVLYLTQTGEERLIAPPPPPDFVACLRAKGVQPLSVGRSIVATWQPNENVVLETIRELGLEWQVIFNKGAVMCLPPGINKASGLAAALEEMQLSPHNVVGVGDAENDHAFLAACGCSVAVANAIEAVQAAADFTTRRDHGAGVAELIDRWVDSPQEFAAVRRHDLYLGEGSGGTGPVRLRADDGAALIAGSSGVGKSRLTSLLIERMIEGGYQVCIVDPEGDYGNLANVAHVGDPRRTPEPDEAAGLLEAPRTSIALSLLGTEVSDRPLYFSKLVGRLHALRATLGRPHWLVLDEAHHLSPNGVNLHGSAFPADLSAALFVTTRPGNLSPAALGMVRRIIAVGGTSPEVIREFCESVGEAPPSCTAPLGPDEVLLWERGTQAAQPVAVGRAKQMHQRHVRKYAEGQLGEDKSFYFRGPELALNLRAQNLATFIQMANGVDDATWLFHLSRGDYTRWFRDAITDGELADEARGLESLTDPVETRAALAGIINRRYAARA